jgi:hypothetical protein
VKCVFAQVREVVYDFFGSRYAQCLARLQRLAPLLRLDLHLAPHLDALHAAVRSHETTLRVSRPAEAAVLLVCAACTCRLDALHAAVRAQNHLPCLIMGAEAAVLLVCAACTCRLDALPRRCVRAK